MSDARRSVPHAGGVPAFDAATVAAVTDGEVLLAGSQPIRGGAVDSRRVVPRVCFFALPGARTDGHNFLAEAARAGAAALVVTRPLVATALSMIEEAAGGSGRVTVVRVSDGLAALHALARAWRDRLRPLVIGVTGSIAKTSTKEAIAETLSECHRVLRSEGNENNEIGVPLTLLRLSPEDEVAVLEMGMYVPGDIAQLAALARPRIGVVTAVRGTHLSRAGSIEAIEAGKAELVEALPADGTAILNADDPRTRRMSGRTRARSITYGFSEDATVTAEEVESLALDGMRFVLRAGGVRRRVVIPALGRHSVHNALAGAAAALAVGMSVESIERGLRRGFRAPHRTALLEAGDWRILDDSYNAAPDSMAAALELLAALPGRRIAVLGEMLELGDGAWEAHRQVGQLASVVADLLVV
ncbi:MAG: UDP-N-acetylmuramoyl-tripeptide--D-alanyl-D-alanine ligase, partial [Chloroflexota bacterium]|nr:UDP-N-acetylmuramoyl-tripeptide--D-alanyl-D-alanine ligase [Chloroflexota bacterium]